MLSLWASVAGKVSGGATGRWQVQRSREWDKDLSERLDAILWRLENERLGWMHRRILLLRKRWLERGVPRGSM
jgi:hypothetical protein